MKLVHITYSHFHWKKLKMSRCHKAVDLSSRYPSQVDQTHIYFLFSLLLNESQGLSLRCEPSPCWAGISKDIFHSIFPVLNKKQKKHKGKAVTTTLIYSYRAMCLSLPSFSFLNRASHISNRYTLFLLPLTEHFQSCCLPF